MRTVLMTLTLAVPAAAFPVPKPAQVPSVAGTAWSGVVAWNNPSKLELTVHFDSSRGFRLQRNGETLTGEWVQAGRVVTLRTKPGSVYELTLDGGHLDGTAKGHVGDTHATVTLTPKWD